MPTHDPSPPTPELQQHQHHLWWLEHEAPTTLDRACQAVERYDIAGIGRRPEDWMGRTILHASLTRDRRAKNFRQMLKNPPDWIAIRSTTVDDEFQNAAIACDVFALQWQQFLGQLARLLPHAPRTELAVLHALSRCCPMGAYFTPADEREEPPPCQKSWVCPYCYTRRALQLVDRVQQGVWSNRSNQLHMFRISVSVPTASLRKIDREAVEIEREAYYDWLQLADRLPPTVTDSPAAGTERWAANARVAQTVRATLTRIEYDAARYSLKRLRRLVSDFDVTGGMLFHSLGPFRRGTEVRAFRHNLSLVGTVCLSSEADRERFQERFGLAGGDVTSANVASQGEVPCILLGPDTPDAPRVLLAGTSLRFEAGRLRGAINAAAQNQRGTGLHGALAWQPWWLFDAAQFWSYYLVTRHRKSVSMFGDWRELVTSERQTKREHRREKTPKGLEPGSRLKSRRRSQLAVLKSRKEQMGLSNRKLAGAIGVTAQFVGAVFAGKKVCPPPRLHAMMRYVEEVQVATSRDAALDVAEQLEQLTSSDEVATSEASGGIAIELSPWSPQ